MSDFPAMQSDPQTHIDAVRRYLNGGLSDDQLLRRRVRASGWYWHLSRVPTTRSALEYLRWRRMLVTKRAAS